MKYLNDGEYNIIKSSWHNNDWNMCTVLFNHYYAKKDELRRKKRRKEISSYKYLILMIKLSNNLIKSIDCLYEVKTSRIEYFDSSLKMFDEYIRKIDILNNKK